jgi:hypothetical protein
MGRGLSLALTTVERLGTKPIKGEAAAMHLRCTLMGFERNYQIKIPSKQLNIKKFSTFNSPSQANPWFWTGLIDAEGSFSIIIDINKTLAFAGKLGWRVQSKFKMGLH